MTAVHIRCTRCGWHQAYVDDDFISGRWRSARALADEGIRHHAMQCPNITAEERALNEREPYPQGWTFSDQYLHRRYDP